MPNQLRRNFLAALLVCVAAAVGRADARPVADPVLARFEGGAITRSDMQRAVSGKIPLVRKLIARRMAEKSEKAETAEKK